MPYQSLMSSFLAEQVEYDGALPLEIPERLDRRYRRLVSTRLRLRRFGRAASAQFLDWLDSEVVPEAPQGSALDEHITAWFSAHRFIRSPLEHLDKLLTQAERRLAKTIYTAISSSLLPDHKHALDA